MPKKVQPESERSTFLVGYFPLLNRFSMPDLFICETCYRIGQTKFMGGIRLPSDVIDIFFIQVPISKIKKFMGGIRLPSDVIDIFFIQVPISKIKK